MKRTNIYLEERQSEALDRLAADQGISRAELIRRLLDRALLDRDEDIAADLAALEASFGVLGGAEADMGPITRGVDGREEHLTRVWNTRR